VPVDFWVPSYFASFLEQSKDAKIYCHVRASTEEDGLHRLIKNLKDHLLWKDIYKNRIVAVLGDLSKPLLGLSSEQFNFLAATIDLLIHNGAYVHWIFDYHKLKPTNVGGTIELLRLAVTKKLKAVHHISTTSVFDTNDHKKLSVVYEDDTLSTYAGLSGGYPRTKWVSERLMMEARNRGIPVSIYRPGYVVGDSKHGVWNVDDFLCRLIKGCIQLGSFPALDSPLDMTSVDHVCRTVVYIALNNPLSNSAYNIVNPDTVSFKELFQAIKSFGYPLESNHYSDWAKLLILSANSTSAENALSSMLSHFTPEWPSTLKNPVYDCKNTLTAIKNANFISPKINNLLGTFFSYFIQCGFINPPIQSPGPALSWTQIKPGTVQMLMRTNRHDTSSPLLGKRKLESTQQNDLNDQDTKRIKITHQNS